MDKLPNEILHQIFQKLPQRILKLVRLCCRRWSSVSTEHLFEQIYFASRSEPIRRFEQIVRHPHMSTCVKHLVFDDTQLPKRLLKPLPHSSRLPEHRAWSYSEHSAALDAFRQRYHHQQRISATSEDLTVLLNGLPRLSNLKKVSVIGGPSHLSPLQDPVGPHAQDLAETQVHASYWSYHKENKAYYEPWDSHRVQRLFQALNSAGIRLASLHIGNWQDHRRPLKMGLPLSSLTVSNSIDQASLAKTAQNLFGQITDLNLQIDVNPRVKRQDYSTGYYESLFQFLKSMTRLTRLTFGVTQWRIAFDVFHTQRLLGNTWPDLVVLKLRCVRVDPDTLIIFFARHRNTLKTLVFHHVGFEPNTPYRWLDVAQQGGQLLHLEYVELDVYEPADDSEISGRQLQSTEEDLVRTFRNLLSLSIRARVTGHIARANGFLRPVS